MRLSGVSPQLNPDHAFWARIHRCGARASRPSHFRRNTVLLGLVTGDASLDHAVRALFPRLLHREVAVFPL